MKVYGDIEAIKKLTEWAKSSDTLQVDDNYKTDALLLRS